MVRLKLSLLGGLRAQLASGASLRLPTKKSRALLAYLAVRAQPVSRDTIAAMFWGDSAQEQARQSLRQTLAALRKALGSASAKVLAIEGDTLALSAVGADVDVVRFQRLVHATSPSALAQAAETYQGDLLDGFHLNEAPFEDWLTAERNRLKHQAIDVLGRLFTHQIRADTSAAIETASRSLVLDPAQEPIHRALMSLYAGQEHWGLALRQYQQCVRALERHLGVGPDAETRRLHRDIVERRLGESTTRTPRAGTKRTAARRRSTHGSPAAAEPESVLIGREAELAHLDTSLKVAGQARGRIVIVVGEAGIGKSRLAGEVMAHGRRRGARVLIGRAYETTQILPFTVWVDALRAGGVVQDDAVVHGLDRVWRLELARLFPELGALSPEAAAAGPENAVRLFEAFAQLLHQLASARTVALVLEDLHWADDMSLRLLSFLSRRIQDERILILGTTREEEIIGAPILGQLMQELGREMTLALRPLSESDTSVLVRALTGAHRDDAWRGRFEAAIWASCQGNPFMVVETARALLEGDAVAPDTGVRLPERVRTLVAGRLGRLSPTARNVVAVAATIRSEWEFALLQQATGLAELEAATAVEELVRRKIMHARGDRFDFTHDRIREVAYGDLLLPKRRALHAEIARALQTIHKDRLEAAYDRLAYHYCEADDTPNAVEYLTRFARKAARAFAYPDALTALQEALVRAQRLPEDERDRRLFDLVPRLARTLAALGRVQDALDLLDRQKARVEALDNPLVTGRYFLLVATTYNYLPGDEGVVRSAERAIKEATRCGDHATMGKASYILSFASLWSGHLRRGVEYGRAAVSMLERSQERWWEGHAHWMIATNLMVLGEFEAALEAAAAARAVGEALNDPRVLSCAARNAGVIRASMGEYDAGIALCRYAVEQAPDLYNTAESLGYLGVAYTEAGDAAQAVSFLERSVRQESQFQARTEQGWLSACLSDAYLIDGRVDDARESARQALELAKTARYRPAEGAAQRALGNASLAAGDLAEAAIHLAGSLETFVSIEAAFFGARTVLDLGRLARAQGDDAAVSARLAEAESAFLRVKTPNYVERTKRLRAELERGSPRRSA